MENRKGPRTEPWGTVTARGVGRVVADAEGSFYIWIGGEPGKGRVTEAYRVQSFEKWMVNSVKGGCQVTSVYILWMYSNKM